MRKLDRILAAAALLGTTAAAASLLTLAGLGAAAMMTGEGSLMTGLRSYPAGIETAARAAILTLFASVMTAAAAHAARTARAVLKHHQQEAE